MNKILKSRTSIAISKLEENLKMGSKEYYIMHIIFRSIRVQVRNSLNQIDSSTIDGNAEFVHSQYSCTSVNSVFESDKIINNSDNFRIKCFSYSKNFVFLVIFDTCDVLYNWSISLLPPILLDNLFGLNSIGAFPQLYCTTKVGLVVKYFYNKFNMLAANNAVSDGR